MAVLTLYEKLDQMEHGYLEMRSQLSSPEIHTASRSFPKLAPANEDLSAMVQKYREWKLADKGLTEARQILLEADDPEMKQLAEEEEKQLTERKESVERE